jgi:hypothetical protein
VFRLDACPKHAGMYSDKADVKWKPAYLLPLPEAIVLLVQALPGRDVVTAVETGGVDSVGDLVSALVSHAVGLVGCAKKQKQRQRHRLRRQWPRDSPTPPPVPQMLNRKAQRLTQPLCSC